MTVPNFAQEALLLFTRYPVPGRVKTRLIPALGPMGAANLQRWMTERMFAVAALLREKRGVMVEVQYDGGEEEQMLGWVPPLFHIRKQIGEDLGQRLRHAVNITFARGVARVVVIGADCPFLTADLLAQALDSLQENDMVLGPSKDGGYYLVALRKQLDALWHAIDWGTEKVFRQTVAIGARHGLSFVTLPALPDIDRPEDLPRLAVTTMRARHLHGG